MFFSNILAVLALLVALSGTAFAEDLDTVICHEAEPINVAIPEAIEKDARVIVSGKDLEEPAYFVVTDLLVSEGKCYDVPHANVVFQSEDTWCSAVVADACFTRGPATATLLEGGRVITGYAFSAVSKLPSGQVSTAELKVDLGVDTDKGGSQ